MRILITGAAGFIGSHLADRLSPDHHVVGADNFLTGSPNNVGDWDCFDCDIFDRGELYRIGNELEPELVIHCAASYSDPDLWHRDTDTNIAGTINAVNVARYHGARLVYFQTALPPISSYAISKIAAQHYIDLSGIPALTFRLANIYGPRNISGPIPTFYKRLTAGQPCTVTDTRRDTVYIDDLVHLVVTAINRETTGTLDVCSGEHYPIWRYYDAVANELGISAEPTEIPRPADDVPSMSLSPHPTTAAFGWQATTPLEEGIAKTVAWYREHGVGETFTHLKIGG